MEGEEEPSGGAEEGLVGVEATLKQKKKGPPIMMMMMMMRPEPGEVGEPKVGNTRVTSERGRKIIKRGRKLRRE